jgi:hypothetical protein
MTLCIVFTKQIETVRKRIILIVFNIFLFLFLFVEYGTVSFDLFHYIPNNDIICITLLEFLISY